jgi:alkylhydroperoxidase family enzyme
MQWRDSDLFRPAERAALDYADAMTRYDRGVDDAVFSRLKEFFIDDAIVELTALIAFQNLSSKFNSALAVPAQGFCVLPEAALKGSEGAPNGR